MDEVEFPAVVTDFKETYIIDETRRQIRAGEVCVRVESAAISPNDSLFTLGYYGDKIHHDFPIGVGFEGSGLIVEAGEGVDQSLINKKIAFLQQPSMPDYSGTWRSYVYMKSEGLATYPDELDFDSIATISINPPTV